MSDDEVEALFKRLRWSSTNGAPTCPHCGGVEPYEYKRPSGSLLLRCKVCRKDFSITSGTLFASRKLPLRVYLLAIAIFCNEVKGKSMLALGRDLGVQYKTAFVLAHKLREAMAAEVRQTVIGGEGKTVEVDAAYYGGYKKPRNRRVDRENRRYSANQTGKRRAVVVVRERDGRTIVGVFQSEAQALGFIRQRVAKGTEIVADEAAAYNDLLARYEMQRVNHTDAYSLDGINTNRAESFHSRMRRAEIRHHHHLSGPYLLRFAQEAAWREDHRRDRNGDQVDRLAALAMVCKPSVDFSGYWERARAA